MDMANCSGSTSLRLRLRISASCRARDCSRSRIVSRSACSSASIRSTAPVVSSTMRSTRSASFSSLHTRQEGRHRSRRSVCHRKSSTSRYSLPGLRRRPRPMICWYRLRTLVGRRLMMQSTEGQSQPSVSSMLFVRTSYLPRSKSSRSCARSGLSPLTSAARKPRSRSMAQNFREVLTSGRNTTVLRPRQYSSISSAICARYGSSALPMSSAL